MGRVSRQTSSANCAGARFRRGCRRCGSCADYRPALPCRRRHAAARAVRVQVSLEVYTLLCSGLADGAMARCGSLLCTRLQRPRSSFTSTVNGRRSDTCCAEAIESVARRVRLQPPCTRSRGYLTVQALAEMGTFEATRSQLLDRLGRLAFDGHYGWASHILKPGTNEPVRSFTDIEEVVLPHLRPYYQLASHNVHAKAKGIYHRLGLMGDHEILFVGGQQLRAGRSRGRDAAFGSFVKLRPFWGCCIPPSTPR